MVLDLNSLMHMDIYDKEEVLTNIYDYENSNDIIKMLVNDSDEFVKNKIAEVLKDSSLYNDSRNVLFKLSDDNDSLIRTSAIESLQYYHEEQVYIHVKNRLTIEKNLLVKSYAVVSFMNLGLYLNKDKEVRTLLEKILTTEKRGYCKASCYYCLIFMGNIVYLDSLIKLLDSVNYRTQSITINFLEDLIEDNNISIDNKFLILNAINRRKAKKNVFCVQDKLEKSLLRIYKFMKSQNISQ